MIALIEQMVAELPGRPGLGGRARLRCCWVDRRPDGADVLARAAAEHFEHLRYDQNRMIGLAMYADTAAQTGSVEAAAMLYELIEPYADQFIWNGGASFGHARTYPAMLAATLGRHELADAHFAFACEFHHQHGPRVGEARSELGWAEALADRGEPERAREHASRALEPRAAAIMASTPRPSPRIRRSAGWLSGLGRRVTIWSLELLYGGACG